MKNLFKVIPIILLFSCANQMLVFNSSIKKEIESNSLSLDKLQFFLSTQIQLVNESSPKDISVKDGKIASKTTKVRNTIIFPKDTKGVFVREDINTDCIYVKFEEGGTEKEIKFGLHENGKIKEYRLLIENSQKNIRYDNTEYKIITYGSHPTLLLSSEAYQKIRSNLRYVKGVKVSD